ncbi:hypothetical protein P6F26_05335 [Roseibacterium sp. SDUM158017]|uniref:hypothetical protein n=1 Tax=Roseicyclus salinarum TaxID=3036773 RepID=UPI0024152E93|nr:hypothetical protein [Roseibacterium sp. SDUM158017]MDG4647858.1 hypothetical protein [Roseibacterium sp. SDUM158017]
MPHIAISRLAAFLKGERGGVETISFVLWLPFVMTFFMIVTDATYILFNRSNIVRVIEDGTRLRSVGVFTTNLQTEQLIQAQLRTADGTTFGTVDSFVQDGIVHTRVTVPISGIDIFGLIAALSNDASITIWTSRFKEDLEA